jgi:hypothetical protein
MKISVDKSKIIQTIYNERYLTVLFSVLFVLSLLPIFVIAVYSHPGPDDYGYGVKTRIAYVTTHNIVAVLTASTETVVETYNNWQGTFFTTFLISLNPAVFDESLYPLTTFVMLFMLVGSTVFLLQTLIAQVLGLKGKYVTLTGLPILYFSIQSLPLARHAFFWYTGSICYPFFYCLMLLLLGLCVRLYIASQPASQRTYVLFEGCRRHLAVFFDKRRKLHHGPYHGASHGYDGLSLLCLSSPKENNNDLCRLVRIALDGLLGQYLRARQCHQANRICSIRSDHGYCEVTVLRRPRS